MRCSSLSRGTAILVCVCLGLPGVWSQANISVPVPTPAIYTHGRVVSPTDSDQPTWKLPMILSWPGSAILTYWSGKTLTVDIYGASYWQAEIDGVVQPQFFSTNTTQSYPFSALATGIHSLLLTKLSEVRFGLSNITAMSLDPGGTFVQPSASLLPAWVTSGRRIEIFGDSYAIGYGNAVGQSNCTEVQPVYQQTTNPLLSPIPLAASHFDADYHLTAWAAAGLTSSLQGSPDLPDFWNLANARNATSRWNFSTWQPEVVINGIGSNDVFAYSPDDARVFGEAYLNFSLQVQQVYPNAHYIVMAYAPDTQMFHDEPQPATYTSYMQAAFSAVRAGGINATFLQLSGVNQSANPCSGHPDASGDASMAEDIIAAIEDLGIWS